jgi:hypothetical protein
VKRKAYFALACIALIFAAVAAKVFADAAHVEDVDAGGVRHVYVPQTQPSELQPLPRVEVFDLDGARRVFVLPQGQPTTKPVEEPPATQPAPTGDAIADLAAVLRRENREPTQAEIERCERWALAVGGAYVVPAGAKPIAAGADLTKLSPGDYAAAPGAYPFPNGRISRGVRIYAVKRNGANVKGKSGQQTRLEGKLFGFAFDGGGRPGGDNHNAGVLVGNDAAFVGGQYVNAVGVAVAGGQFNDKGKLGSASNAKILGNLLQDNGISGSGGKFRGGEVAYNVFRRNNAKEKDGDGGNVGKFSRVQVIDVHHNVGTDGVMTDVWFDINNAGTKVRSNLFARCRKIKQDFEGGSIKHEIGAPGHEVTGNIIFGQWGPAVALGETRQVRITGNVLKDGIGPEGATLHGRQLDRNDEQTNADVPGSWHLGDVLFDENFLLGGKGRFTKSNSGTKLTRDLLTRWKIVIGVKNVGTLDIRF